MKARKLGKEKRNDVVKVGSLLLPSTYIVEPKSIVQEWCNHWNYKWRGRNSLYGILQGKIKFRYEGENMYIVQDESGALWKLTKDELENILHRK